MQIAYRSLLPWIHPLRLSGHCRRRLPHAGRDAAFSTTFGHVPEGEYGQSRGVGAYSNIATKDDWQELTRRQTLVREGTVCIGGIRMSKAQVTDHASVEMMGMQRFLCNVGPCLPVLLSSSLWEGWLKPESERTV